MARPDSAMEWNRVREMIVLQVCPMTGGLPTRLTEDAARRTCAAHQEAAQVVKTRWGNTGKRKGSGWCGICCGRQWPDELTIIEQAEVVAMASKRHKGTCEGCGSSNVVVGKNHGRMMCTTCNTAYAAVNNRLPVVAAAVVELGKVSEFMGLVGSGLPEQVGDAVESMVLARIAEAVGYDGKDADGLVAAVERIVADRAELSGKLTPTLEQNERMLDGLATTTTDRDRAVNLLRSANAAMPDGMVEYEQLPERIAGLAADYNALLVESRAYGEPAPDVIRALGMPDRSTVSQVWEAAIQTCAQLESFEREVYSVDMIVVYETMVASDWQYVCRALFGSQAAHIRHKENAKRTSMAIIQACAQLEDTERQLHTCMEESLDAFLTLTNLRSALGVEDERMDLVAPVAELAQGFDRYRRRADELAAENARMAAVIERMDMPAGSVELSSSYTVDPVRDGLVEFALRVLAGEVALQHIMVNR